MNLYLAYCKDGKNYMGNRDYISKKTGIPLSTIAHAMKNITRYDYYDGTILWKFDGIEATRKC